MNTFLPVNCPYFRCLRKLIFIGVYFFALITTVAQAQPGLPKSSPAAEGVSAKAILNFLDKVEESKHQMHSIMILRHGKLIAEGWWKPFQPTTVHTMYSVSKSFTATAIGLLVNEHKLSVDDKVISFFPDDVPDSISPNLAALRIRDLLSMSVGQEKEPTWTVINSDNWVRAFLKAPVKYAPGTTFLYNSLATYMLSAIVQKVSGESTLSYLQTRLFDPLDIHGIDWETDPHGINTGGWGLRLKTADMAKFGQLFLQKGQWHGRQVLPADWVDTASTKKIMQNPQASAEELAKSDWLQGYCFQMWRSRHNSYRGDGAYGQYILVLPNEDAVIAITSETADMQAELDLVWDWLLPAFKGADPSGAGKFQAQLKKRLATLSIRPGVTAAANADGQEKAFADKNFGIISLQRGLDSIQFNFKQNTCTVQFHTDSVTHRIDFGKNQWILGTTTRKGPYLVAGASNNRAGLAPFKIAGAYSFPAPGTLELKLLYYESPHTETIRCHFDGDTLRLEDIASFSPGNPTQLKALEVTRRAAAPQLIMRADDMGFAHGGNLAIEQSYLQGITSSIEILAVSPWFPEAARWLAAHPQVESGLHFAITSEWDNLKWRPLTAAPSLRNPDGYFFPMLFPNRHYPQQAVVQKAWSLEDMEQELIAQIRLAKKYLPGLHHISGHMGSISFDPKVTAMVKRVAAAEGLVVADARDEHRPLQWFPARIPKVAASERISRFIAALDKLQDGQAYLYVEHPALDDAELQAISHIGYEDVAADRQAVTDLFTSEAVKAAIVRKGIHLVGYGKALK